MALVFIISLQRYYKINTRALSVETNTLGNVTF